MSRLSTIVGKELRRRNVAKLKELGYTYKAIGSIYGVSDATAYYWLCGGRRSSDKHRNKTYFRPKPPDGRCEVCGRVPVPPKHVLQHHHWDHEKPNVGIWVCSTCHFMVELLDKEPGLAKKYLDLKRSIIRNYERHMKNKEPMYD